MAISLLYAPLLETIIFALIERACFKRNKKVYARGEDSLLVVGTNVHSEHLQLSFLEFFLLETERVHARMRRYTAEDENAFFADRIPAPLLPFRGRPAVLKPNNINLNSQVLSVYEQHILPSVCEEGDDEHYGSSASCDIVALQAISKRIHYGKQVAEVKFCAQQARYTELIRANDRQGIMDLLTDAVVEKQLLERIQVKATTYGQEITSGPEAASAQQFKIPPHVPEQIYERFLIPLTKQVEVEYLMQRLQTEQMIAFLGPMGTFTHIAAEAAFKETGLFVPFPSTQEVLLSVLAGRCAFGVVPFSNTRSGVIRESLDLLSDTALKVVGEVCVKIAIHLLARDTLAAVRRIASHPNAFQECRTSLVNRFPQLEKILVASTAAGAEMAAQDPTMAALGGTLMGMMHHLQIVQANLQDSEDNMTRFLVLGKDCRSVETGADKTLLLFTLRDPPGAASCSALSVTLALFAQHGLAVTFIETATLPAGQRCQTYMVELRCHVHAAAFQALLSEMLQTLDNVTVLGSFHANSAIIQTSA